MKKLMIHIPDGNFKMVRYLGAYTSRKKKLCACIRKMLSKPRAWIRKKLTSYQEFRKESTGIDPLLCSCGHVMEFVESFFPSGLEVKINETWKFVDWQNELDPLQVYSVRLLRSHGNRHCGRSLRLGYRKRNSMFFRLLYPLWFSDASGRCSPENF